MKIGSFFEFPKFDCRVFRNSALYYIENLYKNYSFFRDGRQAIKAVLLNEEKLKGKTCYLPAYLCYSILQPFKELKLKINFYNHNRPLKPIIDGNIKNSLIFILDYFGTEFLSNREIRQFLKKDNIVILDITHSIFNKERFKIKNENLYLISSLRKVFPIPDGGILYHTNSKFKTKKSIPKGYEKMVEAMTFKSSYLEKREKNIKKDDFLNLYKDYEIAKDKNFISLQDIPAISLRILKNINISNIFRKRLKNLEFMYKKISNKKLFLFDFKDIKSPFTLPILFESEKKRDVVKKFLIKNNIYSPIHWDLSKIVPRNYSREHKLSKKILSIPIDQRYNVEDLMMVINILNNRAI